MARATWLKSLHTWITRRGPLPVMHRRSARRANLVAEVRTLDQRVMLSSSAPELWSEVDSFSATTREVSYLNLSDFTKLTMNESAMRQTLDAAPDESAFNFSVGTNTLTLVDPDGNPERFAIYETAVMAPELAAQFPDIKTYSGQGIDDPTATVQLDLTPQGFHAQVLSEDGRWYVDPYFHLNDDFYASYYARDAVYSAEQRGGVLGGDTHGHPDDVVTQAAQRSVGTGSDAANTGARSGTQLRTYRAAIAASGEYTAFHGGTVGAGQAAIVTAMNRVNGIYETELSIRMQLIANNSSLVYTNALTDPYTNDDPGALLDENQANLDSLIGSANYDIGHVFTTGGGGLAGLGVVGINGFKAWGETGLPSPTGDVFWVDFVAHEIGHQFGGRHTFNQPDSNRDASAAYEPGSGSTIQAYAGLFGVDDLQSNSDAYFHSVSFDEIIAHVDNVIPAVGTRTATGNAVPTVNAGSDFTIPAGTPFILTASGNDANGNASLTYNWEQRDLGPAQTLAAADNGSSPLFRSFTATSSPSRTFPSLSTILTGTAIKGEKLPALNRAMDFRVTVRDNDAGGGGVNTDDMIVNVVNTGAAFAITSQNSGGSFGGNTAQTVTWNVAGTTANGINTANVRILLSTDGGNTFGTVLAASTPNDGTQSITLPNIGTTQARIKVEAVGNIFFDITNANFTITAAANQNPVVNNQSFLLLENRPNGTNVGTVAASDPDAGQTLTYAIIGGNTGGAFAINASTGQLTVANTNVVNYEVNPAFNLTVQVTDNGSPNLSDTATITVNLSDLNEAPNLFLTPGSAVLDENMDTSSPIVVSTAVILDDALGVNDLSLLDDGGGIFELVGNQLRIKAGTVLDFESNPSFSALVQVEDLDTFESNSKPFSLSVFDVDEAPVGTDATFTVAPGASNGTVVGTVSATDPEGEAVQYFIFTGNTDFAFNLDPISGQITVADSAAVTLANGPFTLEIHPFDPASNFTPFFVTINVTNPNTTPTIGGAVANQALDDNGTRAVFSTLTVADPDNQAMSAQINILNGIVRGDFTAASATGWTRSELGNDIRYTRIFPAAANIGSVVQAAIRTLVFDPRELTLPFGQTETTTFSVTVSDGVASAVSNSTTSVITTSVNDVPTVTGAVAGQTMNDNSTRQVFSGITVTDPDNQAMTAIVRINDGTVRGDFTPASRAGWNRLASGGTEITYSRTFPVGLGNAALAQAAIRALVFDPRENAIRPNTTETTTFNVSLADGVVPPVTTTGTSVITTSVNDNEVLGGQANVSVNDNATINPLSNLTVTDPDFQEGYVKVTILNAAFRGDFTPASATGWTKTVQGNNFTYYKYFNPGANIGSSLQAAARALVFQPRQNAIQPGTTELTDFQVVISDGIGNPISNVGSYTRVVTTSVNNAPTISGAVANQGMLDSETRNVFSTLVISDPDFQNLQVQVTVTNGTIRGDFTVASRAGWTRTVVGNDIRYLRSFGLAANIGQVAQNAVRALVFQPRNNVPVGTSETTGFTVFVSDGTASTTNNSTTVVVTGVAPRAAASTLPEILESDVSTVILSSLKKPEGNPLAGLLKRKR